MSQKRPHPTTGEEEGKKKKPEEEKKQQDKAMASSSDPSVFCDVCAERKEKAVKSCLMCPSSYCETHLETHHSAPHQKKHKLINPVENLEDYICQKHERPLEWFCRDDQTCVCLSCTEGEHRTHNTVPLEEESQEKKTAVHQMTQDRIKKIKEIRHSLKLKMKNTKEEKSTSVELFTDLIRSIERCQSDQLKMMEEQQKAAEKQAEDLIKELHQEITELEQLSDTDDHLHLIQMCSSLDSRPHTKNWTEIRNDSDVNVNSLHRALAQLKKSNQELKEKLNQTGLTWAQAYAVDVTLDPDTANPRLILSDDGKQVSRGDIEQDVPENPKRFSQGLRVLAKQGFSSGRFYYEVQVKGKTECFFGVARESINRNVTFTQSPDSGLWILSLKNENEFEPCDSTPVPFFLRKKPEKVGVFVDYEEGLVSFYNVESRSHIYSYTFQTFTDKLYPVFNPGQNGKGKGKNSNPLIITPVS